MFIEPSIALFSLVHCSRPCMQDPPTMQLDDDSDVPDLMEPIA